MSETSVAARKAMKEKAKRMTTDPHEKTDASSWEPSDPLNTTAKTGLRPVSKQAYRRGGKVHGEHAKMHAGKKPRTKRASGGNVADEIVNRNVKDANAKFGKPHEGGYKKGGEAKRARKTVGGKLVGLAGNLVGSRYLVGKGEDIDRRHGDLTLNERAENLFGGNKVAPKKLRPHDYDGSKAIGNSIGKKRKGKMIGGPMMGGQAGPAIGNPQQAAAQMLANSAQTSGVPTAQLGFQRTQGTPLPGGGMKKGGIVKTAMGKAAHSSESKAKHEKDPRKRKEMKARTAAFKHAARKAEGGTTRGTANEDGVNFPRPQPTIMLPRTKDQNEINTRVKGRMKDDPNGFAYTQGAVDKNRGRDPRVHKDPKVNELYLKGYHEKRDVRAKSGANDNQSYAMAAKRGGKIKGANYEGGTRPTGGRIARKAGGKTTTKGKTNINILIGSGHGQPPNAPAGMPMPPPPGGPPLPPPMPAGAPPGMPMAPPGGMPMPPPGATPPQMGHASGGRTYRSFKDMDAGAGSGRGRLEKEEIQRHHP